MKSGNDYSAIALHGVIMENDVKHLKYLLDNDKSVNVNQTAEDQATALHLAAEIGNITIIEMLIKRGAKMNSRDGEGRNPLHLAAQFGNYEVVKFLLAKDMEVGALTKSKCTVLHLAVKHKRIKVVELLLQSKPEVNNLDSQKNTPLHDAAKTKSSTMIKLLLTHGASVHLKNVSNETAFHLACRFSNEIAVNLMLDLKPEIDARTSDGSTPLHCAVRNECNALPIVRRLLDLGVDPEAEDNEGTTPLMITAKQKWYSSQLVGYLLNMGPNLENSGYEKCLKLLDSGWVAIDSRLCQELLYLAVRHADNAMLDLLIARKVPIDRMNRFGNTSLLEAVDANNVYAASVLLKSGADPNKKNTLKTESPLGLARSEAMIRLLLDSKANFNEKNLLHRVVKLRYENMLRLFVESGADVNVKDDKGHSVLYYAITRVRLYTMQYLLHIGIDSREFFKRFRMVSLSCKGKSYEWHQHEVEIMIGQFALLDSLNCVDNECMKLLRDNEDATRRYEFCRRELELMRSTRVCVDSELTYHCLLTKNSKTLARRLRGKKLRIVVANCNRYIKHIFPLYYDRLRLSVSEALRRFRLLEKSEELFQRILGDSSCDVASIISELLPNYDLEKFVTSLQ